MKNKETIVIACFLLISAILPGYCCPYFDVNMEFALKLSVWLSASFLTFFVLAVCSRFAYIGYVVLPIIGFVNFVSAYSYFVCKQYYNRDIFSKIMETNLAEAQPYLTFSNILSVILVWVVVIFLIKIAHQYVRKNVFYLSIVISFSMFCVFAFAGRKLMFREPANEGELHRRFHAVKYASLWPCFEIYETVCHSYEYKVLLQRYFKLKRLPLNVELPITDDSSWKIENIVVCLMIGEAVRADHLPFNGYERNTMPELLARGERIISFPNTCSFGLFTTSSRFGILTDAELIGRTAHHRPLPFLLEQLGVSVSLCSEITEMGDYYFPESTKHYTVPYWSESYSHVHESTVEMFKVAMEGIAHDRLAFMLCYDCGAHAEYMSVPENRKFFPHDATIQGGLNHLPELINAYDNALVEIDWELDGMLKCMETTGRPCVFIYAADHGELLGEEGKILHGLPIKPNYTPAIFIWCSDAFIEKYPEKYEALKSNSSKAISHDHILHTVLSLFGCHHGLYQAELDLTQRNIRETPVPEDKNILFEYGVAE